MIILLINRIIISLYYKQLKNKINILMIQIAEVGHIVSINLQFEMKKEQPNDKNNDRNKKLNQQKIDQSAKNDDTFISNQEELQPEMGRKNKINKQRFTIIVGYNDSDSYRNFNSGKYTNRLSIENQTNFNNNLMDRKGKNNNNCIIGKNPQKIMNKKNNVIASLNPILANQKYYFHRKNKKSGRIGIEKNSSVSNATNSKAVNRTNRTSSIAGQFSQRKCAEGITVCLSRQKNEEISKSYKNRINTITHIDQRQRQNKEQIHKIVKQHNKTQEKAKASNILNDVTNKKYNIICSNSNSNYNYNIGKNKLKKKSIINQSDLADFTDLSKALKNNQQTQKQKQKLKLPKNKEQCSQINLRNRKYTYLKAKTQFEEVEPEPQANQQNRKHVRNTDKQNDGEVVTERNNTKQLLSRRIDFKRIKTKNINAQFRKQNISTVDLKQKVRKQAFHHHESHQQFVTEHEQEHEHERENDEYIQHENLQQKNTNKQINQLQLFSPKNKNFNNYLDFINRKKRQHKSGKYKNKSIRSIAQGRSLIVKSTLAKHTISLKQKQQTKQEYQKEDFKDAIKNQQNREDKEKREYKNISNQKINFKEQIKNTKDNQIFKIKQTINKPPVSPFHLRVLPLQNKELLSPNLPQNSNQIQLQFECSSIPQINHSSFLSEAGKLDINSIKSKGTYFQLHTHISKLTEVEDQQILQTISNTERVQGTNQSDNKKKKRKKQSKMSIICRSEVKQAFPQRFFA